MGDFVPISTTKELEDGAMKEVTVRGSEILLARVDGRYYAVDNRCTHMGGKLSGGKLEGTVVTCPRHGSQFDLRNGQVVRWLRGSGLVSTLGKALKSPKSLAVYNVKIEGDQILVEI